METRTAFGATCALSPEVAKSRRSPLINLGLIFHEYFQCESKHR